MVTLRFRLIFGIGALVGRSQSGKVCFELFIATELLNELQSTKSFTFKSLTVGLNCRKFFTMRNDCCGGFEVTF